jgi:hypothetical protein
VVLVAVVRVVVLVAVTVEMAAVMAALVEAKGLVVVKDLLAVVDLVMMVMVMKEVAGICSLLHYSSTLLEHKHLRKRAAFRGPASISTLRKSRHTFFQYQC